jgi:hypothetical protein
MQDIHPYRSRSRGARSQGFRLQGFHADVAFSYHQIAGYTPHLSIRYVFK